MLLRSTATRRLGFGQYQFEVLGRLDRLDKNVVLGLFNYPPQDIGTDGTQEIDIEFAHWGKTNAPVGNYTVWPAKKGIKHTSHAFGFTQRGEATTQRFTWSNQRILFQSLHGHRDDDREEFARWSFQPPDYPDRIGQKPMPAFINLWLFRAQAPSNGKEVEIIIKSFKFTPG